MTEWAATLVQCSSQEASNELWLLFPKRRELSTVTVGAAGPCTRIVLSATRRDRPINDVFPIKSFG